MKKQFDPWEKNLGKRLKGLQPEPAFDAWDRIDAELHKKPYRSWFWIAASLALFVASAGLIVWQADLWPNSYGYADQQTAEQTDSSESKDAKADEVKKTDATTTADKLTTPELAHNAEARQQTEKSSTAEVAQPKLKNKAEAAADNAPSLAGKESAITAVASNTTIKTKATATTASTGIASNTNTTATKGNAHSAPNTDSSAKNNTAISTTAKNNSATAIADNASLSLTDADEIEHQQSVYQAEPMGLRHIASIAPLGFPLEFNIEVPAFEVLAEESKGVVLEKVKKGPGISLVAVWVEAMPSWSYRRVAPNQTDAVVITSMEQQAAFAGSRMGGQLAAGITYPLSKKLKWKTGAYYWYQQQRWSYTYHTGRPVNYVTRTFASTNSLAVTPMYSEQNQMVDLTLHNIGISTGISYQLPTLFAPSTLETKIMAHYNTQQKFSSTVSIGYLLQTMLDNKRKFNIGPSMQIQLNNNQNLSPHFQERPVSAGMQMGVTF